MLENFNVWDTLNAESGWAVPDYTQRFNDQSFKLLSGRDSHTIFKNNRPLAASMKTGWFDCNPQPSVTSTNGPKAVTILGWKVSSPTGTF